MSHVGFYLKISLKRFGVLLKEKNVERLIRVLETLSFILNLFYLIHLLFSGRGGLMDSWCIALVDERYCADS